MSSPPPPPPPAHGGYVPPPPPKSTVETTEDLSINPFHQEPESPQNFESNVDFFSDQEIPRETEGMLLISAAVIAHFLILTLANFSLPLDRISRRAWY